MTKDQIIKSLKIQIANLNEEEEFEVPEEDVVLEQSISDEASQLLGYSTADDGEIRINQSMTSYNISAGRKVLFEGQSPREKAKWLAGIEELELEGFIDEKGEDYFSTTHAGYLFAEKNNLTSTYRLERA